MKKPEPDKAISGPRRLLCHDLSGLIERAGERLTLRDADRVFPLTWSSDLETLRSFDMDRADMERDLDLLRPLELMDWSLPLKAPPVSQTIVWDDAECINNP